MIFLDNFFAYWWVITRFSRISNPESQILPNQIIFTIIKSTFCLFSSYKTCLGRVKGSPKSLKLCLRPQMINENKLFTCQFWTVEKFVSFFNCSTEKNSWKIFGCLMSRTRYFIPNIWLTLPNTFVTNFPLFYLVFLFVSLSLDFNFFAIRRFFPKSFNILLIIN